MDEFDLINKIKQSSYRQATLVKGVGDDGAVIRQSTQDIVTAVDTFVEGVHFTDQTMPPFYIGYRSLAANISDLAAMGALPAFYLVSIIVPKSIPEADLESIFKGMNELAHRYHMDLIGGDTVSGTELSISITIIGYVDKGKARYRHHASSGDVVFVTGTLGDSQAGFHMLTNNGDYIDEAYYVSKHQMPSPRIDFANGLINLSRVALNDISDGIANEATEIATASNINIILFADKLPVHSSFHQFPKTLQNKWKWFGGEDFELLGTVPKSDWNEVKKSAKKINLNITEIGYVDDCGSDNGQVFLYDNGVSKPLQKRGYIHLK